MAIPKLYPETVFPGHVSSASVACATFKEILGLIIDQKKAIKMTKELGNGTYKFHVEKLCVFAGNTEK